MSELSSQRELFHDIWYLYNRGDPSDKDVREKVDAMKGRKWRIAWSTADAVFLRLYVVSAFGFEILIEQHAYTHIQLKALTPRRDTRTI